MIGALLIQTAKKLAPGLHFVGVPGPKMAAEGCESIFEMSSHAAMLLGAVRLAGRAHRMMKTCRRYFAEHRPTAAVFIDSPTLHLRLAGYAKNRGIPVLYYVAPQTWAWAESRVGKIRKRVDQLACILPFEEEYFRRHGISATYVGHPLMDLLQQEPSDVKRVAELQTIGKPFIALLPGSRKHVVKSLFADQILVAKKILERFPSAAIGVSVASSQVAPIIDEVLDKSAMPVVRMEGRPTALIRAADLVLVASGTTALEVAIHRRPMIVMYQASRLFYQLVGRWLIKTKYLSLPNILAGREIVPEFMPYYRDIGEIVETAIEFLSFSKPREKMRAEFDRLADGLGGAGASRRVAEMLFHLIHERGNIGSR